MSGSITAPRRPRSRRLALRATLALLGVVIPAAALAALALTTASGVTSLGGDSYETEFIQPGWWAAGWLLVVPVFLAARTHRMLAAPAVVLAAAPQFLLAGSSSCGPSTRAGVICCSPWGTYGRGS